MCPTRTGKSLGLRRRRESLSDNQPALVKRVSVEVFETEELTEDEQRERLHLERKVERAFYEAGKALKELRDRRLYRSTHKTFEDYCRSRFGQSRQKSNFLIAGAMVFENLTTIRCQILPTNEDQVRSLTSLEPDQQCEVWQQAVSSAGGKVPLLSARQRYRTAHVWNELLCQIPTG